MDQWVLEIKNNNPEPSYVIDSGQIRTSANGAPEGMARRKEDPWRVLSPKIGRARTSKKTQRKGVGVGGPSTENKNGPWTRVDC